jgi:ABC-type Mn2+/Zn2+ transport system ATPase subunit
MAEIGRLRKNETTEVVVQKTEFHGSVGIDVREYVTSERYTGWSKNGIRIPVEKWQDFKEILDKVDNADKADNMDKADKVDKVDTIKKVDSA